MARPRESVKKRLVAMISGLKRKKLPKKVKVLEIASEPHPLPRLLRELETSLKHWTDVDDLAQALRDAVRVRNKTAAELLNFLDDLDLSIVVALGRKNPKLRDFGIKPEKERRRLTTEEQARANAKRKATRARNRS
jgi:hypothetical protein